MFKPCIINMIVFIQPGPFKIIEVYTFNAVDKYMGACCVDRTKNFLGTPFHFHISQELSIDLLNWLTHPGLMRVQPPLALWYYMPANISLQMSGYERAS